jgi:hypothetical protein
MTMKRCDEWRDELLPGYALKALDPQEQGEAEAHVQDCPDCKSEAEQVAEALHLTLGQGVPPAAPSPLLRTQFLARLALEMTPAEAQSVPGRPAAVTPPLMLQAPSAGAASVAVPPRSIMARWMIGGAALPAAVALVLGIGLFNMKGQLDQQRSHALYTAFVDTPHVAMPLQGPALSHGMTGEVIMPTQGTSGLVIVSGMPKDTGGRIFTCWLHRDGHWAPSGDMQPDASGIAMVVLDRNMDLHNVDHLAITMDRAGKLPTAPTQPMLSTAL